MDCPSHYYRAKHHRHHPAELINGVGWELSGGKACARQVNKLLC